MVAPYAGIIRIPAGQKDTADLHIGYERHRGAELQTAPAVRARGHFPTDEAAMKLLFLF
jgi:hypothetical protein